MTALILVQWLIFFGAAWSQFKVFSFNIFHPNIFYLAFHFLVFVLHPTLAEIFDFKLVYQYMDFFPDEGTKFLALLLSDVGLFVFMLSAGAAARKAMGIVFPMAAAPQPAPPDRRTVQGLVITAVILAPFILGSMFYWVTHPVLAQHNGNIASTTLTTGRTGARLFSETSAYVVYAQYMAAPICVAWAYVKKFRWLHCLPFVLYVAFRTLDGESRVNFALLGVAFGLAYLIQRHLTRPNGKMVALAVVLLVLFGTLGGDRKIVKRLTVGLDPVEQSLLDHKTANKNWADRTYLDGMDFANYEYLTYVITVVPKSSGTYTYFTQYLTLLIKPIPRVLWPGKPEYNLISLVNLNDYGHFDVMSTSLVGDGWMSLGWLGMIITMAATGFAYGRAYLGFAIGKPSHFSALTYSIVAAFSIQFFRDGGVTIFTFLGINLLPIFIWWLVTRYLVRGDTIRDSQAAIAPAWPRALIVESHGHENSTKP